MEERAGVVQPAVRVRPEMDPPNVLWFFGTFATSVGVYVLLDAIPDSQNSLWILLAAIGFTVGFAAASLLLLQRLWWVPGGLAATLAVASFPAVAVGFLRLIDVWPEDPLADPLEEFSGYPFGIALATAFVGIAACVLTRFSFLLFVVVAAILVASQLLVPTFDSASSEDRATAALVAGALLVIVGVFLDAFGRRRDAFWFHALGWLSVAAGLVFFAAGGQGDPERGWVPMLIVGLLMLGVAGPIRRATWAVYGAFGFYAAIVHYLSDALNEGRWPFAVLLLALGLGIFLQGLLLHRYGKAWAARFTRRAPPTLGP